MFNERKIMSISNKAFRQSKSIKAAGPASKAGKKAQVNEGQNEFVNSFRRMTARVAGPIFEQLAHVAKTRGYPATVKEGVDEKNNPYHAVAFIPEVGARSGAAAAKECIFQLKALLADQSIEYTACHDPRAGKKGVRVIKSDLQSINKVFLEAEIEEFVTASLEAREPT